MGVPREAGFFMLRDLFRHTTASTPTMPSKPTKMNRTLTK